jgi:sugar O-acyltransferase (sialic acid O-acetyltransferase NeuD family)
VSEFEFYLLGYSGHAFVVLDSAIQLGGKCLGYYDQEEKQNNPFHLNFIGPERAVDNWSGKKVFPAIGNNSIRYSLVQQLNSNGAVGINIVDRSAIVSEYALLGRSNYIAKGSVIQSLVTIGDGCIINTGAIVDHECHLKNGVHISPRAVLCGGVQVGERTWIGAGTVIKEGVVIGSDVLIGAGSVVLKDIPDGVTCWGAPAVSRV